MAQRKASIDQQRYARWVSISHCIDFLEPNLNVFIQGLGKIDAQLIYEDDTFQSLATSAKSTFEESLKLTDRFTLSQLWILGAYEVIRTLDQRVSKSQNELPKRLATRVKSTKKSFERLRVPLAKFEPARAHKETDFSLACPAMHKELGISWKIAERTFIPRRRLSDQLLTLFSNIDQYRTHQ